jgi:hypothetical protein
LQEISSFGQDAAELVLYDADALAPAQAASVIKPAHKAMFLNHTCLVSINNHLSKER